ncbi:MAG: glutamate racemase [Clostridia bacterium]|nr:glutamate racemase [Clostridia bacterium]
MKIGFFDSGVGGISVMTAARGVLPNADYIYYADEAHVPYGTKSHEEIIRYADEAVGCLVSHGAQAVVVACNTATSIAIEYLRKKYTLPIIGMEPALKPAVKTHPDEKILLCATPVTIAGEKLHHLIEKSGAEPTLVPLPGLVTFAENGVFDKETVCDYLAGTIGSDRDFAAVVLGCTHFSFFKDCFRELLGKDVDIIDGNVGTVKRLISVLGDKIDDCQNDVGSVRYLISGDEADELKIALFENLAERYKSIVNI